jgi:hypothetical protein
LASHVGCGKRPGGGTSQVLEIWCGGGRAGRYRVPPGRLFRVASRQLLFAQSRGWHNTLTAICRTVLTVRTYSRLMQDSCSQFVCSLKYICLCVSSHLVSGCGLKPPLPSLFLSLSSAFPASPFCLLHDVPVQFNGLSWPVLGLARLASTGFATAGLRRPTRVYPDNKNLPRRIRDFRENLRLGKHMQVVSWQTAPLA